MTLSAGVNNLFDKVYRDHTNGINRVADSDVTVGDRLPGPGRSLFARVNYRW
jgi:iron complex outermembrane receptor protein